MDENQTPAIELYGMGSPNVRKVGIMLEELGLSYALRFVSVFKGEQFDPAFQALNPACKVPVLVDHARGMTLFESAAILFYLAETHGRFLPAEGPARYETMQWLAVQTSWMGPMLGQLNHFALRPEGDGSAYAHARYRSQVELVFRLLEDRLTDHEWLAGDAYSIADIAAFPWAFSIEKHRLPVAGHPAVMRWRDAIAARPAVIRFDARYQPEFVAPTRAAIAVATAADLDRFYARKPDMPPADFSALARG